MERKTVNIVGFIFNQEDFNEILDYLEEKKVFSKKDKEKFNDKVNKGDVISQVYNKVMNVKKVTNPPVMEVIDNDMSLDEYFFGYRIHEKMTENPTENKALYEIKQAQNNWFRLFGEIPITESVSFVCY